MVRIDIKVLIFTLLASFTSFGTVAEFPKSCLSKLFPNFNKDWEKYVLYFLNNKKPLHDQPSPDNLLKTRVVAAEDMIGLDRGAYRLSDTFNVVIHQLEADYMKQIHLTRYLNEIFVPSRSIYLYITADNWEHDLVLEQKPELANWHPDFQVFPALKLILTMPQSNKCNRKETSVNVICSGYCSSTRRPVADFKKGFANSELYSLHHSLFWNGNKKVIPALVFDSDSFIEDTPKEEQGVCISQTNRINHKCREDIMTMLTYGEIHNLTISLNLLTMENAVKYGTIKFDQGPEQLTFSIIFAVRAMSVLTQFMFHSFVSSSFLYCPRLKSDGEESTLFEFGVWCEPFTPAIWLSVLSILIFGILCCFIHFRDVLCVFEKILNYWAAVFGADVNPRYFILVSSVGFLLTQIYSNGLTSIITVRKAPDGFTKIEELLQAGYKILIKTGMSDDSIEDRYGEDFRRLGLSTDGVFEFTADTSSLRKIVGKFSENNERRTILAYTSMANLYRALAIKMLRNQNLTTAFFTCFVVKQALSEQQSLSITETENQHWIYVTSQRIRASGLFYKWSEWSNWHELLKRSLLEGKYNGGSDTVDSPKFLAIQLVWGGLLIISLAIFCVETKLLGMRQGIRKGIIVSVSVICSYSKRLFRRHDSQPSIINTAVRPADAIETQTNVTI
ncbi:unnamed protein product [Orchesella dallaii]|uniref:Uncharacterized protein n=1 Tax=Orchesella dallaii TaxID=48710 RepID=A0ABP1RV47_9HEXA